MRYPIPPERPIPYYAMRNQEPRHTDICHLRHKPLCRPGVHLGVVQYSFSPKRVFCVTFRGSVAPLREHHRNSTIARWSCSIIPKAYPCFLKRNSQACFALRGISWTASKPFANPFTKPFARTFFALSTAYVLPRT